MKDYFHGTKESPYHISIGAVLINDKDQGCCHYFEKGDSVGRGYPDDFYMLMHETLEDNETLENALHRGLREEFAATAELLTYLGSVICYFTTKTSHIKIEKTVPYFLCKLKEQKDATDPNDPESVSKLLWLEIDDLVKKLKAQAIRAQDSSIDEARILERVKEFFQK